MIQKESILRISDNSGGVIGRCINVYRKKIGIIGDLVLISIVRIKKRKIIHLISQTRYVSKHILYKAIIVSTRSIFRRFDGRLMRFSENNIVLLSPQKKILIGSRILCPVVKEFRKFKKLKFMLLSSRSI